MATYSSVLSALAQSEHINLLTQLNRGIEKEGLRCSPKGIISQKMHPKHLGSKLTHPYITTDYSEALLEFITPVYQTAHETLAHLDIAHRYTYKFIGDELIWPNSMPCVVRGEMSVPIADYGTSNLGKLKHVYRHGLWHRYGRVMQCIAGIHYNFSVPDALWEVLKKEDKTHGDMPMQDYISMRYLGLIRNFRRYSWMLLYAFGASPAVCETFLSGREHNLQRMHQYTLYAPYATSLRMSDLGYQNNAQADLHVCHNSLEQYISTLSQALTLPVKKYDEIGLKDTQGNYKQLNTHLLQIENEYYSDIRPKRVGKQNEKPLQALEKYGIEYIEVRNIDINPFMPLGIDVPQMAFLDVFLTWCLLSESPEINQVERERIARNHKKAVNEGRRPNLMLETPSTEKPLQEWGLEIIAELQELAALMDKAAGQSFHVDALNQQAIKFADSSRTPSAQVLSSLEETGLEYGQFTLNQAQLHSKALKEPLAREVMNKWQDLANNSWLQQQMIEQSDTLSFDEYLTNYLKR